MEDDTTPRKRGARAKPNTTEPAAEEAGSAAKIARPRKVPPATFVSPGDNLPPQGTGPIPPARKAASGRSGPTSSAAPPQQAPGSNPPSARQTPGSSEPAGRSPAPASRASRAKQSPGAGATPRRASPPES